MLELVPSIGPPRAKLVEFDMKAPPVVYAHTPEMDGVMFLIL